MRLNGVILLFLIAIGAAVITGGLTANDILHRPLHAPIAHQGG